MKFKKIENFNIYEEFIISIDSLFSLLKKATQVIT